RTHFSSDARRVSADRPAPMRVRKKIRHNRKVWDFLPMALLGLKRAGSNDDYPGRCPTPQRPTPKRLAIRPLTRPGPIQGKALCDLVLSPESGSFWNEARKRAKSIIGLQTRYAKPLPLCRDRHLLRVPQQTGKRVHRSLRTKDRSLAERRLADLKTKI